MPRKRDKGDFKSEDPFKVLVIGCDLLILEKLEPLRDLDLLSDVERSIA